jgi:hypothetical protein
LAGGTEVEGEAVVLVVTPSAALTCQLSACNKVEVEG